MLGYDVGGFKFCKQAYNYERVVSSRPITS